MKDDGISADKHALIIPPIMGRAKRVHPMPFSDSSISCKFIDSVKLILRPFKRVILYGLAYLPVLIL